MGIMNQLKTVILLGALTGILLLIGSFWGQNGLLTALIFSIIMNLGAYWFSDKIVLAIYRAKEIKESEEPELYKIVRDVAKLANIPMPRVYMIDSPISNAMATGRNYKHATVAVTRGIIKLLSKDELKGVIAHEVSHIKNRDILIQSVAATIAGVISYIAMIARFGAIFGGNRNRDGGNVLGLLVIAILTPLLATIIQLAISRAREYIADSSAAKLINKGEPLAKALEKLDAGVKHMPLMPTAATETTAHVMIVNPFSAKGLVNLFSTHPPVAERAKRLRSMKF